MFNCGEKITFKNVTVDVEITGLYPASQSKDGKAEYVATVNGEKMRVKESFFDMLKQAAEKAEAELKAKQEEEKKEQAKQAKKEEVKKEVIEEKPKKEVKKNGRRK